MGITINGSSAAGNIDLGTNGTITDLAVGGLPDGVVDTDSLANNAVTDAKSTITEYDDNKVMSNIALLGFKTAVNGSLAKYSLVDQIIDEYTDGSGVDASASTGESLSSGQYSGATSGTLPTGGTITTVGDYKVHSFTSTGNTNFVVSGTGKADALLVAGGGGGGGAYESPGGAGGGGGGVRALSEIAVTAQTYVVTVGAGGDKGIGSGSNSGVSGYQIPTAGGNSSALGQSATGGGRGATYGSTGSNGGSGGGPAFANAGGTGNAGGYSPVEGYNGGQSCANADATQNAGGGGGAGAAAACPGTAADSAGGNGGSGIANNWRTGSNVYYGGGGGGGHGYTGSENGRGVGGNGGGGDGGAGNGSSSNGGGDGTDGLGGGGGGAGQVNGWNNPGSNKSGGDGGNGIVVIRYKESWFDVYSNMTLQSTATTATAAPAKADFVTLIENSTGTATLNTDIKGYVSRDNGSNWTQGTLTDEGEWGTNKKVLAFHDLDISGQPSGTSMKYKIETLNQGATKVTKIHATSLGWK